MSTATSSSSSASSDPNASRRAIVILCLLLLGGVLVIFAGPLVSGRDRRSDAQVERDDEKIARLQKEMKRAPEAPESTASETTTGPTAAGEKDAPPPTVERVDDSSASFSPGPNMPVIPLSSQRARSEMWRRVVSTVAVNESAAVIEQHRRICSDKHRSIRVEDLGADEKLADNVDFIVFGFGDEGHHQAEYAGHKKVRHQRSSTTHHRGSSSSSSGINRKIKQYSVVGFRRLFVAIILSGKKNRPRLCSNGAIIEASLQSQVDMVDVDFSLQVAPGLYEFQPFFRRSGRYTLCLALSAYNPTFKWSLRDETFHQDPETMTLAWRRGRKKQSSSASSSDLWFEEKSDAMKQWTVGKLGTPHFCVGQKWSSQRQCFAEDITLSVESERSLTNRLSSLRGGRKCGSTYSPPSASSSSSSSNFRHDFRSGAWMRLKTCDGDLCSGNPLSDESLPAVSEEQRRQDVALGGVWVFVSDTCTVKLYTRQEAWKIVDTQWILNWGGSTLKQPAANFLEYILGVPVFSVSMEKLGTIKNAKKRPNFFSYRQYEAMKMWKEECSSSSSSSSNDTLLPSEKKITFNGSSAKMIRSTMCWGGCPGMMQPPSCKYAMGVNNRACARRALEEGQPTFPSIKPYHSRIPTVLFLNHFVWRWPLLNETEFLEQIEETVQWLRGTVSKRLNAVATAAAAGRGEESLCAEKPLLVWIGPTRNVYADEEAAHCGAPNGAALARRMHWKLERFLEDYREREIIVPDMKQQQRNVNSSSSPSSSSSSCYKKSIDSSSPSASPFRDVLYLARPELTSPMHTGSDYGHFGVHYGATRGMCLTGISHKDRYSMQKCLRNTSADWMLIQWWLGAMENN